ncbi:MAG: Co2+/Mg2+ efflux protein ApaG [Sphingomonadales bacterium]
MYSSTTRAICVSVEPFFAEDESSPEDDYYVWVYRIRIENTGTESIQLCSRRWEITNACGQTQEVRGPGVIGEQPFLGPGDVFEYTSGAPLTTPSGIMTGSYMMETARGEAFEVAIPAFSLDSPYQPIRLH